LEGRKLIGGEGTRRMEEDGHSRDMGDSSEGDRGTYHEEGMEGILQSRDIHRRDDVKMSNDCQRFQLLHRIVSLDCSMIAGPRRIKVIQLFQLAWK
jgi:hypothetical protein